MKGKAKTLKTELPTKQTTINTNNYSSQFENAISSSSQATIAIEPSEITSQYNIGNIEESLLIESATRIKPFQQDRENKLY